MTPAGSGQSLWSSAFTRGAAVSSLAGMVFLAEIYLPGGAVTAGALAARAQAGAGAVVAAAVGRGGTPARLLQVILLPDDEICFLLYRAESAAAVRAAGAAAGLDFDRVQDALLGP